MENDSIRSIGSDTLVDIWIDGKMRSLSVSHEAIGAFLGFDRATGMSDQDRCEFVRTHLPLIVSAAKQRLSETNRNADEVVIDVGELPRPDGRSGDRRQTDRRKTDRRKMKVPRPGQMERRKGDRRGGERRSRPPKPKDS
jgi:hypothetical protein